MEERWGDFREYGVREKGRERERGNGRERERGVTGEERER